MYRRVAICLMLLWILGTPRESVHAEPGEPTVRAETDSVEVVRDESASALERGEERFLPYAGKPVGTIRVRNLDVFGTSIDDTTMLVDIVAHEDPQQSELPDPLGHRSSQPPVSSGRPHRSLPDGGQRTHPPEPALHSGCPDRPGTESRPQRFGQRLGHRQGIVDSHAFRKSERPEWTERKPDRAEPLRTWARGFRIGHGHPARASQVRHELLRAEYPGIVRERSVAVHEHAGREDDRVRAIP